MQDPKPGHVPQTYPTFAFTALALVVVLLVLTGIFKLGEAISSFF